MHTPGSRISLEICNILQFTPALSLSSPPLLLPGWVSPRQKNSSKGRYQQVLQNAALVLPWLLSHQLHLPAPLLALILKCAGQAVRLWLRGPELWEVWMDALCR